MSIITTVFPKQVQFQGTKIDMHNGGDITPVLNQTGYKEIELKSRFNKKSRHTCILNVPAGFDIETTGGEKGAYMYKWQMTFGEYLISGRTWDEWMTLMEAIQKAYNFRTEVVAVGKKKHTYIHTFILWIANQGYEYQFICRKTWNGANIVCTDADGVGEVFADGTRTPLKTMLSFTGDSTGAITVYDALKFSRSLSSLAKDYGVTTKKKKVLEDGTEVSDLDYSIPRNQFTPLNDEEEEYCDADVAILYEWACFYNNAYLEQNQIAPMTSTAIIRQAVTENYDAKVKSRSGHEHTFDLHPSFDEYIRVFTRLYRGGFTYANREKVGMEIPDVVGKDFTSSYPACMLQEKFPSTKFHSETITCIDDLKKYDGKAWYADFEFHNIIIKNSVSVENVSKLHEYTGVPSTTREATGCITDNGKIAYARKMTVTLCEYDWDTYEKFYEWDDDVKITNFMVADKDYLPDWFTDIIKHYYKLKAQLKKTDPGSINYAMAKAVVNGLYGMTVQRIHFEKVVFDKGEWKCIKPNYNNLYDREEMRKTYEREIGRDYRVQQSNGFCPVKVLSPYWGVWCTAIARNRILNAIDALGEDFVYCDTDSVYYEHEEDNTEYFDGWNQDVYDWNDANLVESEFHTLGDFDPVKLDDDEKINPIFKYNFKMLGAKRYIKYTKEKMHTTVAGLPHGSMARYAKNNVGDDPEKQIRWCIEHFEDGMKIAADEAMKNAHDYIDEATDEIITDPYGNSEEMHEDSSILIHPVDFSIHMSPEYLKVVNKTKNEILLYAAYLNLMKEDERI